MSTPATNPKTAAPAEPTSGQREPDAFDQAVFQLLAYLNTIGFQAKGAIFVPFDGTPIRRYDILPSCGEKAQENTSSLFKGEGVA